MLRAPRCRRLNSAPRSTLFPRLIFSGVRSTRWLAPSTPSPVRLILPLVRWVRRLRFFCAARTPTKPFSWWTASASTIPIPTTTRGWAAPVSLPVIVWRYHAARKVRSMAAKPWAALLPWPRNRVRAIPLPGSSLRRARSGRCRDPSICRASGATLRMCFRSRVVTPTMTALITASTAPISSLEWTTPLSLACKSERRCAASWPSMIPRRSLHQRSGQYRRGE